MDNTRTEFVLRAWRAAWGDGDVEAFEKILAPDYVRHTIRWQSQGTHTGSFMGVPSTSRTVTVTGASFCRFTDGLLAEEWVVWDPRELLNAMKIFTVPHQ